MDTIVGIGLFLIGLVFLYGIVVLRYANSTEYKVRQALKKRLGGAR